MLNDLPLFEGISYLNTSSYYKLFFYPSPFTLVDTEFVRVKKGRFIRHRCFTVAVRRIFKGNSLNIYRKWLLSTLLSEDWGELE